MEVSPSQAQKSDLLLHLIEVGDRKTLMKMCKSELVKNGEDVGVEFKTSERQVTVMFKTDGLPAGTIRISGAGESVKREFTKKVRKQTGLVGLPPKK